jgi:hypothetical protein
MMRPWLLAVSMAVLVAARPAGAVLTDDEPSNDTIGAAAVQIVPNAVVTTDGGAFTLVFDDIDYVGIGNLIVGDIVTVSTTPFDPNLVGDRFEDPDTFIALFTSGGSAKCENDDTNTNNELGNPATTGLGSLCRFVIDSAGTWYMGVTGFGNPNFNGTHLEDGAYQLVVTINAIVRPFPTATPTATPAATPAATPTPTPAATPTATPTPTPTPEPGVILQLVSGGVGLAWLQRRRNRRVRARSRS